MYGGGCPWDRCGVCQHVLSRGCRLAALPAERSGDEDLLVAVLDEVIFLMGTTQQVPIDLEVQPIDAGVDVRFEMAGLSALPQSAQCPRAFPCLSCASDAIGADGCVRSL
jgi:protein archease